MKGLRLLLLPFAWIYGFIIFLRNKLYDWKVLKSNIIPAKSIIVGNLSVGGTGKTPLVDYITSLGIEQQYECTIVSRGYGRKSKGVVVGRTESSSEEIGDELLMYKQRHGDRIEVIAAEKRWEGIRKVLNSQINNQLFVLDDAFQHRAVQAGLSILVTPFDDLFVNDFVLPAGNLREWKIGTSRADVIVVSKCPHDLDENERNSIKKKLNFDPNRIFFSRIEYGQAIGITTDENLSASQVLIVSGIGNPKPLVEHYQKLAEVNHMKFPDHHAFSQEDIHGIHEKFDTFASRDKAIVTTEKDFMRLKNFESLFSSERAWYYQPIEITFYDQSGFNELVNGYISKV